MSWEKRFDKEFRSCAYPWKEEIKAFISKERKELLTEVDRILDEIQNEFYQANTRFNDMREKLEELKND